MNYIQINIYTKFNQLLFYLLLIHKIISDDYKFIF